MELEGMRGEEGGLVADEGREADRWNVTGSEG